jgi:hypothetical protein
MPWLKWDASYTEHPQVMTMDWQGRVTFWIVCMVCKRFDRRGTLPLKYARPEYLSRLIGGMPVEDVSRGLDQCVSAGLLEENNAGTAWVIEGWNRYQKDSKSADRKAEQRAREDAESRKCAESGETVTDVTEIGRVTDVTTRGEERRGDDTKKISSGSPGSPDQTAMNVKEVWEYWKTELKHPQSRLTNDRRQKIRARLRDGFTVGELQKAIDGCRSSSHHMGENNSGKVYDSVDLIFRNAGKVDEFIGYLKPTGDNGAAHRPWIQHGITEEDYRRNGPPTGARR